LSFTIQKMGGNQKEKAIEMLVIGGRLIPVTNQNEHGIIVLMDSIPPVDLKNNKLMSG